MKNLIILGAGTAGTMMANHLVKKLPKKDWKITIIDQYKTHYYQPGFLFLPFDIYTEKQVKKEGKKFIPSGVNYVQKQIELINPDANTIELEGDEILPYDILVVATGSKTAPEEIDGMSGPDWYKTIFDFYTYEGAKALRDKLRDWKGGKLVVHITEMPIKCPVAPLEFAFLADSYFRKKGMRDKVDITYITPLSGAFTKPKATKALHHLLEEKGIKEVVDFNIERVDYKNNKIVDYADVEVEYDLLVTVPTNMGDELIERSGLGDELNFIPTHKTTLQSKNHENIFVIGDATNLPTSKAGSVAHFEAEILEENILRYIEGKPLKEEFDGHANCFVETGNNKALLIDFNYDHEPVEGKFPFQGIGPMSLLKENRMNHWGKLAFRWIYWNMLLKGIPIPFVPSKMSLKGKNFE
ncbi:sulfide:quinone oxidoreductase [Winogradskyella wandonensis]|uniref:Sulfide:quinone oxidoreductase n=1 Tax=Winogradskyella wandonensis TaxID=1442586 RepID=A0A4R1KKG6_9FLAO|nr:FAD/NAD(P)-binding oxidoreductase [Winogradskyella wandonensis]TCK64833.1 sulfide:quinone oxidoreductase [Winogradskyella wandonensis]